MTACNEHLEETFEDRDGNEKFYYKIVSESALDTAKSELPWLLQAGFDNKIITKEEFEAMSQKAKQPQSSIAISRPTKHMIIYHQWHQS